jgi:hypothetical protein
VNEMTVTSTSNRKKAMSPIASPQVEYNKSPPELHSLALGQGLAVVGCGPG